MADIEITLTIPDAYVSQAIDSFIFVGGSHMRLEMNKTDGTFGDIDFVIQERQEGETLLQYGKRVFRTLGKAVLDMVDKEEDRSRYNSEINAIVLPHSDVDEEIIR